MIEIIDGDHILSRNHETFLLSDLKFVKVFTAIEDITYDDTTTPSTTQTDNFY